MRSGPSSLLFLCYYRLEEPVLKSLWGVAEGFFGYDSPNLNGFGWNLEYMLGATACTCTKNWGKSPQGFCQIPSKCVVSVTNTTWPFGQLSCTDLDHIWNNRRELVSQIVHLWEILEFLCRVLQAPKNCLRKQWGACYQCTAEMVQFWVTAIISGASWHPKDVTFVCEFWWGMYGWRYDSRNKGHSIINTASFSIVSGNRKILCKSGSWISTISKYALLVCCWNPKMWMCRYYSWSYVLSVRVSNYFQGGSTLYSSLYCSESPVPAPSSFVYLFSCHFIILVLFINAVSIF